MTEIPITKVTQMRQQIKLAKFQVLGSSLQIIDLQ